MLRDPFLWYVHTVTINSYKVWAITFTRFRLFLENYYLNDIFEKKFSR